MHNQKNYALSRHKAQKEISEEGPGSTSSFPGREGRTQATEGSAGKAYQLCGVRGWRGVLRSVARPGLLGRRHG